MEEKDFGFKELYDLRLKATYNMRIGNRDIVEGETIARLDKIQVFGIQEINKCVFAHGGYWDKPLVYWEHPKELQLQFTQGVLSKKELSLLWNSKMLEEDNQKVWITKTENIELDENSQATLSENPTNLFLYNVNGEKFDDFTISEKTLTVNADPYSEFTADYQYKYQSDSTIYTLGRNLINGFVELEARTRVKDDETGHVVTGIIKIPKLKLLSNFSIRLGRQTDPMIGRFNAIGVPVGSRDNSYVCEFFVLNDDVDSDI